MSPVIPKEFPIKSETDLLREYWISKIDRAGEAASVPFEHLSRNKCTSERDHVPIKTEEVISSKLREVAGDSAFLQYTTFISAIAICLFRYTGNYIVVVGSPSRIDPKNLPTKSNAVPVVVAFGEKTTFRHLLQDVRETLIESYKRQTYPFEQMLRDMGTAPGIHLPIFRVAVRFDGLHQTMPDVGQDLDIELFRSAAEFSGAITFKHAIHSPEIVKRFWCHVNNVLFLGLTQPETVLRELQILAGPERDQIVVDWNRTEQSAAEHLSVQELFEEQVRERTDGTAVVLGPKKLSYEQLNEETNQLAWYLRKVGVGPEVRVGLYMDRSLEAVVGMLGILKAGGTYVPLDRDYPAERLKFMVRDSGASILLTRGRAREELDAETIHVLDISGEAGEIGKQSRENLPVTTVGKNAAYIIYTSGSSGQPKGSVNTYGGLLNLALAQRQILALTHEDKVLQFASLSFDAAIWEWLMVFTSGAQLIVGSAGYDAAMDLKDLFNDTRLSIATLPPSVLRTLSDAATPGPQTLVVAGEVCPTELARKWSPGRRMLNAYGPTEATVCATISQALTAEGNCPIGRPIANTQVYILDSQLEPIPVGVPGELYIGGEGLARGYINLPEMTADRFIPNLFSERTGERLYRTGDIGKWRSDGNIEFVCRKDEQVKIRGHRIELGEIEAVLGKHASVEQCVVAVQEKGLEKNLASYVVKTRGIPRLETGELQVHLRQSLPEYMVPSVFVFIDALPLTSNGKLDRRALCALAEPLAPQLSSVIESLPSKVEQILCEIWAQVLEIETVGVKDNFFELGGHSLRATQVVSKVRRIFGIELPVRRLFEAPTVSKLAISVEAAYLSRNADFSALSLEIERQYTKQAKASV